MGSGGFGVGGSGLGGCSGFFSVQGISSWVTNIRANLFRQPLLGKTRAAVLHNVLGWVLGG